jgi:transcriptional repressor NrdR
MRCPNCASLDTQVKDSRPTEDSSVIRRRRVCLSCNFRFTTFERVQLRELTVIKRNGRRVPFDHDSSCTRCRSRCASGRWSRAHRPGMSKIVRELEPGRRISSDGRDGDDAALARRRGYVRFASSPLFHEARTSSRAGELSGEGGRQARGGAERRSPAAANDALSSRRYHALPHGRSFWPRTAASPSFASVVASTRMRRWIASSPPTAGPR